ncbi:MAG: hypothetical protein AAFR44_09135, partial [Pseudomonadota bacterium]
MNGIKEILNRSGHPDDQILSLKQEQDVRVMPDLKFDANGKYYKCFPQQNKMSCGVACIRMVNHYLTGKDIGAAVVRHYVGLAERPEARPAMRGGVVPQATAHNFETTGISLTTAAKALHYLRPPR